MQFNTTESFIGDQGWMMPFAIVCTLAMAFLVFKKTWAGGPTLSGLWLVFLGGVAAMAWSLHHIYFQVGPRVYMAGNKLMLLGVSALPVVWVPFALRLWCKWNGGGLTDAEKAAGWAGVKAWLCAGNVAGGAAAAVWLWLMFEWSLPAAIAIMAMVVLAYPLIRTVQADTATPASKPDDTSPERERVLKMLEDGKITAQESADLLNALGHSASPRPTRAATMSSHQRLALIGAALVMVAFFLPWFSYNVGNEINRAMAGVEQTFGQMPQEQLNLNTGSENLWAADVQHGLGWVILLLGVAAAALPLLATGADSQTIWKATLAILAVGAFILLYLVARNLRFVSIGIVLAAVGYVLEVAGTLRERPA